ncbi:guanine nucleotide-binding protein subunit gamma 1-like isoform X1 [Amaranthus tricolor]|uniref:guanine nucleotide-binding protein subunit gamma 1-like isoform X1 n=1 Tax=Amaranthus tricolor TaxID=29722 RepID=UPI00258F1478|nr:guanine nucleotide-binding protein subunit gamma 1-like isoform X1 [Amaranthus tricolor]
MEEQSTAITTGESSSSIRIGNGRSKHPSNFIGRHRLQAEITHLQHQIEFIEKELDELESIGGPSTVCDEIITGVETIADPLLPMTRGPVDVNWERWFRGGGSSRSNRRWI